MNNYYSGQYTTRVSTCPYIPGIECSPGPERWEQVRSEIACQNRESSRLFGLIHSMEKSDRLMRRGQLFRRLQEEKEERTFQECMCKSEQMKEKRRLLNEQAEQFANAIRFMKDDEILDYAYRKQLQDCSPEIRDLQRELRRAYFAKTLHAQRLEGESKRLEEKMIDEECHQMLMENLAKYDANEELKEKIRQQTKEEYMKAIQLQLNDSFSKKAVKKIELENDKAMINEIVKSIEDEIMSDLVEKVDKINSYKKDAQEYVESKEAEREREKQRIRQEEDRINDYLESKEEEISMMKRAKDEKEAIKSAVIAKNLEKLINEQFQQEEIEARRREQYEREVAEEVRRKEEEEKARKCKLKEELKAAAKEAKKFRAQKLEAEQKEEELYRQQLIRKFAEDDKLEILTKEKRRLKGIEHRKKVEMLIMERRALFAAEREKENGDCNLNQESRDQRQEMIDAERIRLLKEHVDILEFIPRGTIKSREELEKLGEPFISYFTNPPKEFDPKSIDNEPCEDELYKCVKLPKHLKY